MARRRTRPLPRANATAHAPCATAMLSHRNGPRTTQGSPTARRRRDSLSVAPQWPSHYVGFSDGETSSRLPIRGTAMALALRRGLRRRDVVATPYLSHRNGSRTTQASPTTSRRRSILSVAPQWLSHYTDFSDDEGVAVTAPKPLTTFSREAQDQGPTCSYREPFPRRVRYGSSRGRSVRSRVFRSGRNGER